MNSKTRLRDVIGALGATNALPTGAVFYASSPVSPLVGQRRINNLNVQSPSFAMRIPIRFPLALPIPHTLSASALPIATKFGTLFLAAHPGVAPREVSHA